MKPALSVVQGAYSFDYEVDKAIPIPPKESRCRYPFELMKVGDSFFVPNGKGGAISAAIRVRTNKYPNEKYTRRSKANGIRVWRIS